MPDRTNAPREAIIAKIQPFVGLESEETIVDRERALEEAVPCLEDGR